MANTKISNAAAIAACDAVVDLLDAAGSPNNGYIEIRTGTQPSGGPDAAAVGTLLATLVLSEPAFGNAADDDPGGTATANTVNDDDTADATGTATWFRAYDANGVAVLDGDVTATGGGGDLEINSTSIQAGTRVSITSWTVTMPEG